MPSCRLSKKLWVLLASAMLLAAPMLGQTFFGSIVGTVSDSAGAVMPGVTVTLTNNGTGAVQTAATSGEGNYRFVNLVPGVYRIDAEQTGFRRYTRDNIRVEVEGAVRLEIAMQVGEVTETVEVTADVPTMQTENANLSQVVAGRSVQEIPLNGRNVLNLVALVPGVVPQGLSMAPLTGQNVFAAGNYQIGGGSANQSASFFDGVPMNVNYGNLTALVPTQDAVSEFRVQTNSNSAEYGRYTGGVINIVSKSGTNEFHGGVYEFIRNKKLNATDFFANSTGAGKAAFTQNQYGAFVGGPIVRDKTFFYAGFEGYRQRYGRLYLLTVPTEQQLVGDFSNLKNAAGALIPVYDPLTQCGAHGNPACASGVTDQRTPFANNQIPANRFDSVSKNVVAFPYWAKPNTQGRANTNQFNYSNQTSLGGNSDQLNFRGDHTWSDKQRWFGRYTWWESLNKAAETYKNGLVSGDPVPPEYFLTQQAVFGDTYLFSPTTIFDVRLSYMRWYNDRTPGTLGIDLTTLGFPRSFKDGLPTDRVTVPRFGLSSPTYDAVGTGSIGARTNNYTISTTLTKIAGKHTWKFGAELRRLEDNYWQNNNAGGVFNFNNLFTSRNALSPGATGDSFASFLLGYVNDGLAETVIYTANGLRYQGYFVNDTWQVTPKLTVNLGLRWEIPGAHTERFDRQGSLNLSVRNPVSDRIGQTVLGNLVLVGTPNHPSRGLRPETYTQFAPRVGIAYRFDEKTVIRVGGGIFHVPSDSAFWESAIGSPLNLFANAMVSTTDGSVTPTNVLSDPFPNGLIQAPGRNADFESLILGLNLRAPFQDEEWGYTGQWNLAVQREVAGVAVEAAYAGLRGVHLSNGGWDNNVIGENFLPLGTDLRTQVTNPFFGQVKSGILSQRTVQKGQLLRPYPQYTGARSLGYIGNSIYHSLQMKAEKRFSAGGSLLASYTFSKLITDVESNTGWLDGGQLAGYQNQNNMRLERSLSSFDSRRRLVVSYVLDLPFGKGRRLGGSVTGIADKLVSGWGINGVTTLQDGFPLGMTATPNQTGLGTGLRPNVQAGCNTVVDGAAQAKLNNWLNQSCYSVPASFTFGSLSRTDPNVRLHGIANFDFAIFKRTHITESTNIEFRTEFFNLFNRVQFGRPNNQVSTAANSTFGFVTSQANLPRLIQFALRLNF